MPIAQANALTRLIQSLTKAEKRNFKLYLKRIQKNVESTKFIQLFECLDKNPAIADESIRSYLQLERNSQLTNLRRHLYQHICTSLRLDHIKKRKDIQIREWIDYAHILYGKGLYLEALKILKKAKDSAKGQNLDILHLDILEFEKLIETRHITRNLKGNTDELTDQTTKRSKIIVQSTVLSNLVLALQGRYIKEGFITEESKVQAFVNYYQERCPAFPIEQLTFFEKVYYAQVQYWRYFIVMDFKQAKSALNTAISLFQKYPQMLYEDKDLYIKLLHQFSNLSFLTKDPKGIQRSIDQMEVVEQQHAKLFNTNSTLLLQYYWYLGKMNFLFVSQKFEEMPILINEINQFTTKHEALIDPHQKMIFDYKMSGYYLLHKEPEKAIPHLNLILNQDHHVLKQEIQIYARLLFLMAHFDLKNYDLIEYLTKRFQSFFRKKQMLDQLQQITFQFFKHVNKWNESQKKQALEDLRTEIKALPSNAMLSRSLTYLPIDQWLGQK